MSVSKVLSFFPFFFFFAKKADNIYFQRLSTQILTVASWYFSRCFASSWRCLEYRLSKLRFMLGDSGHLASSCIVWLEAQREKDGAWACNRSTQGGWGRKVASSRSAWDTCVDPRPARAWVGDEGRPWRQKIFSQCLRPQPHREQRWGVVSQLPHTVPAVTISVCIVTSERSDLLPIPSSSVPWPRALCVTVFLNGLPSEHWKALL